MFDARELGIRVLVSRRDLGLDQVELSRRSGVSRSRISEIERGKGTNVGIDAIYGLASALGVSVAYLLGLSEDVLGEGTEQVLNALTGDYVTFEVENAEQRNLIQEAIDALFALPVREQRRALQFLRMMRQIEQEEQGVESPRVVE